MRHILRKAAAVLLCCAVFTTTAAAAEESVKIADISANETITASNGEVLEIVRKNNGNLSFVSGRYTDQKVTDPESALASVEALNTELGLDGKTITLAFESSLQAENGDVYYKFLQLSKGQVVQDTRIIVGADSDGNVISLTSSINLDVEESTEEDIIDGQIAVDSIKTYYDSLELSTEIIGDPELVFHWYGELCKYSWRVIATDSRVDGYMVYYLDAKKYEYQTDPLVLDIIPRLDVSEGFDEFDGDIYFQGKETQEMSFTDYFGNEVSLPVATGTDEEGNSYYYLLDTGRRIFGGDYDIMMQGETLLIPSFNFTSPEDLDPVYVTVFANMQKIYDFYLEEYGIQSANGKGIPLMLLFNYLENGKDVDNAAYMGNFNDVCFFSFGRTATSTALDTSAHEYGHAIKSMRGERLEFTWNFSGSIEEAYGDILGKLLELIVDPDHSDPQTWEVGYQAKPIRSMSDPGKFLSPVRYGGAYFVMDSPNPSMVNDNGGVHINNTILSHICYLMTEELGLSIRENFDVWFQTLYVMTGPGGYDDVCAYLKHVMRRNGFDTQADEIQSLFEEANVIDADQFSWEDTPAEEDELRIYYLPEDRLSEEYLTWVPMAVTENGRVLGSLIDENSGIMVVDQEIEAEMTLRLRFGSENTGIHMIDIEEIGGSVEKNGNILYVRFSLKAAEEAVQ